jgi:hypothetical protein
MSFNRVKSPGIHHELVQSELSEMIRETEKTPAQPPAFVLKGETQLPA